MILSGLATAYGLILINQIAGAGDVDVDLGRADEAHVAAAGNADLQELQYTHFRSATTADVNIGSTGLHAKGLYVTATIQAVNGFICQPPDD